MSDVMVITIGSILIGAYYYMVNYLIMRQYKKELMHSSKHKIPTEINGRNFYVIDAWEYENSDMGLESGVIDYLKEMGYEKNEGDGSYQLVHIKNDYMGYNSFSRTDLRLPLWYIKEMHNIFMDRCDKEETFGTKEATL